MMLSSGQASSDVHRLRKRREGRLKIVAKKASKKSTKKSSKRTTQTGKKRATDNAATKRAAKVQRGTSGTGPRTSGTEPRIAGAAGRAKKAKEKSCD